MQHVSQNNADNLHTVSHFFAFFVILPWIAHRSTKTHPGPVVHISDNPMDEGKVIDS